MRIMIFSCSPRYHGTCPGQDGKSLEIAMAAGMHLASKDVEVDFEDISVKGDGKIIQPCKGCQSTAGGYHCHWPCDCYGPGSAGAKLPDIMHGKKIYKRMQMADGFAFFTPINWYAGSSQLKAMIDRLVCADKTLTHKVALQIYGHAFKDPEKTVPAYERGEYDDDVKNHLQGKMAAFFVHGDDGADERGKYKNAPYFQTGIDPAREPRNAVADIVASFRYMGVEVHDDCWQGVVVGKGKSYAENNEQFAPRVDTKAMNVIDEAKRVVDNLRGHLK